jgi:hypothetical protein
MDALKTYSSSARARNLKRKMGSMLRRRSGWMKPDKNSWKVGQCFPTRSTATQRSGWNTRYPE